jgi:imidazolonepropionase
MDTLDIHPDGALAVAAGKVVAVGPTADLQERYEARQTVDASGQIVLPGFVDAHTHPVFVGTREGEFDQRVRGVSYQEITRRGGGIFRSVEDLRAASDEDLAASVRRHLEGFLEVGTTTIEAKSGYGLTWSDECRSLETLQRLAEPGGVRVVPTFLGAHQMPKEFQERRPDYVQELVQHMIPEVARRNLARYCDVFCDYGAFEVEESRQVLEAARSAGLGLRIHAEELGPSGGADLAAELGAATADHLVHIRDDTVDAFAKSGVQPVLLPGTCFSLGLAHAPPARKMIDRGLAVVLATDFNPGTCYIQSPLLIVAIACQLLRMTVAEGITAMTANAAASLGLSEGCGALLPGLQADAVFVDGHSHLLLGYRLSDRVVRRVLVGGRLHEISA